MKTFFTTVLCALTIAANAQTFKEKGKSIDELCPFEEATRAEGDFNKDGIQDVFYAASYESDLYNIYAFYFGKNDGGYQLFNIYFDLNIYKDAKISVNDKGVLRIQNDHESGSDIFLFRYQNGGFYLIGGKKDRHKKDHYDYSYNFSTKKYIKTTGEGKNAKTETFTMGELPTLKFGWVPLKWDMLDYIVDDEMSAEYKTVMGIFRLLQFKEAMHWAFCDYEQGGINPEGSNGKYSCFCDYTGGSYWIYEKLIFTKRSDTVWDIEYTSDSGERTYEEYEDEDGETYIGGTNEDSDEDSAQTEEFSFEDGVFAYG